MKIPKVVVAIEDGLVQWVASNKSIDVAILNLDTENADDDELAEIHFEDGPNLVHARTLKLQLGMPEVDSRFIKQVFSEIEKEDDE